MKKNILYSVVLLVSIVLFTGCGTDQKENAPEPDGPYSFFDASTPLKITKPSVDSNGTVISGDYNITVKLLEFDLAKSGESIQMKPFSFTYGFVTQTVVTTDESGTARFIYNPPTGNDYEVIKGQDIIIQAVYLNSIVDVATPTSSGPTPPDILLTQDFVLQFR